MKPNSQSGTRVKSVNRFNKEEGSSEQLPRKHGNGARNLPYISSKMTEAKIVFKQI